MKRKSFIYYIFLGLLLIPLTHQVVYAKEVKTSQIFKSEGFVFYQSPYQENVVNYVSPFREQVLLNQYDAITSTGERVKVSIVAAQWVHHQDHYRAAVKKAKEAIPGWQNSFFSRLVLNSKTCQLAVNDRDIKHIKNSRHSRRGSDNRMCVMSIASRNGSEDKVAQLIENNALIDPNIEALVLHLSTTKPLLKLAKLEQTIRSIQSNNYLSHEAAFFFTGFALAKYEADEVLESTDEIFEDKEPQEIRDFMQELIDELFDHREDQYRLHSFDDNATFDEKVEEKHEFNF